MINQFELADVVRRFGKQYIARHGNRMMPSQRKALQDIAATSATTAAKASGITTAVATAPARSVMAHKPGSGSPGERPRSCRAATSTPLARRSYDKDS